MILDVEMLVFLFRFFFLGALLLILSAISLAL